MKFKITLIAFLLIIISVIITLNFFFHRSYESEMAAQINEQQLIIAKTVANSIHDALEHFEEEAVSFAGLLSLRGMKREGMEEFVNFALAELKEDVHIDVILLDADAGVFFSTINGYSPGDEDLMIFDASLVLDDRRAYLYESFEEPGKIKISAPLKMNGKKTGLVLLFIDVEDLNEKYIAPVRSGERGYAWIMDSQGTLVYHPMRSDMIGKNIFSDDETCYECHTSFNTEIQILASYDVGFSSYIDPHGEDKLIAFSRVKPVDWIVCVSIPYSEVTASITNSMKLQSMLVLTIVISTVVGAFIIIVINRERVEAETRASYADKIREYARQLEDIVNERTKELKSEKEKLDAVIGSIEAGICIFDEAGKCAWMNKVMHEWLSGEYLEDFTLDRFCRDFNLTSDVWAAIMDNNLIQNVAELDLGNKKGHFQMALSPLHAPGGDFQLLLLMQDVTELKSAEEKLIQSEKLAALSRLSAGVAHEIGNPLTSISSYVQILRDMEFDEFTKGALETISKHIERISSIVKKMSSYSSTRDDETRSFDLKELIDSTIELVKYDKGARKVQISVNVNDGVSPIVVNGNQMLQIFINLVMNAADAMPDGGRLDITASRADGEVEIAFKDTGHGIKKEQLDRVFDPFFTTKERGTGLGLSVSYGIIKSFGGDISVESEPGRGTTFKVRLPVHGKH